MWLMEAFPGFFSWISHHPPTQILPTSSESPSKNKQNNNKKEHMCVHAYAFVVFEMPPNFSLLSKSLLFCPDLGQLTWLLWRYFQWPLFTVTNVFTEIFFTWFDSIVYWYLVFNTYFPSFYNRLFILWEKSWCHFLPSLISPIVRSVAVT